MALDLLGYPTDHPDARKPSSSLTDLMVDDGAALLLPALLLAGLGYGDRGVCAGRIRRAPAHDALRRAADWLLTKEVRRKGDWSVKRPKTEPSGWYFEFANEFYPDIDDTAMVLLALNRAQRVGSAKTRKPAEARAIDWLLAMQSKDGGWAAFDVDNNWEFLSDVPFADHNAMLDPTCPDITGRVLEALCAYGSIARHPAMRRGVRISDAHPGSRRKLVRTLGRGLHLRHVSRAARIARRRARAIAKLTSSAPANGCARFRTPMAAGARAAPATTDKASWPRPSTPSQTAWAILGLLAGGDTTSTSVHDGIEYSDSRRRRRTGRGTKNWPPARDFPRCST